MAMKYVNMNQFDLGAESGEEAVASVAATESRLHALQERLQELGSDADPTQRADLAKEIAGLLIALDRGDEAWISARPTIDVYINTRQWEKAVEACDLLYRADQQGSISALGQGVWLAVTFPVDPELTVAMLQHIVDETPDDADGATVAAATAVYVVDLRAEEKQHNDLHFFAMQLLGGVARRHANVSTQDEFDSWMVRLELTDPTRFLVRMRNVIDVMVQDDWWFDRGNIQATLPVN
jgi:hypothetical protein